VMYRFKYSMRAVDSTFGSGVAASDAHWICSLLTN
jgi:hypothetical protein